MKKYIPFALLVILLFFAALFVMRGCSLHRQARVVQAEYETLQEKYYLQSKEVRDAAETGSELAQQFVELQHYPSRLEQLRFVGLGRIAVGMFFVFLAMLVVLLMLPKQLGRIVNKHKTVRVVNPH